MLDNKYSLDCAVFIPCERAIEMCSVVQDCDLFSRNEPAVPAPNKTMLNNKLAESIIREIILSDFNLHVFTLNVYKVITESSAELRITCNAYLREEPQLRCMGVAGGVEHL